MNKKQDFFDWLDDIDNKQAGKIGVRKVENGYVIWDALSGGRAWVFDDPEKAADKVRTLLEELAKREGG